MIQRIRLAVLGLFTFLACLRLSHAQTSPVLTDAEGNRYVTYTDNDGTAVTLPDNRRPALYTGDFGDCMGGSTINVTRFDAAYYKDNMTVLFHLAGNTGVANDSVMLYIGVYAYGESRFSLIFNPCSANIGNLCPMNGSVPIEASGIIPVAQQDVAGIPPIALSIPDFEGEAILRIFSNTTQTEIACYSAVVTNGNSFGHPTAIGTVLGLFTLVAMIASFSTAVYGQAVPTMRLHYAHSLSVGVVFAVWHHIFFTGALSVNWPSVLVAWWSNFAWSGGMIYSSAMQDSINQLIGNNIGNTSHVGAAQTGGDNTDVGGGYDVSLLYKRVFSWAKRRVEKYTTIEDIISGIFHRDSSIVLRRDVAQPALEGTLQTRAQAASGGSTLGTAAQGYHWYGKPTPEGLPLPGNFSGFAGTLGQEGIRASNAFMTGLIWFVIILVILVSAIIVLKWSLEGLARCNAIKKDRLDFFRAHWLGYTAVVALRICYIGFFVMLFLSIFQFSYESSSGVKAIAGIVFIVFFIGMLGAAAYGYWYRLHIHDHEARSQLERKTLLGRIPWIGTKGTPVPDDASIVNLHAQVVSKSGARPSLFTRSSTGSAPIRAATAQHSIHDDEDYTRKFGWLAARFRRTRWWFFAFWLCYEFLRAIFYGGASGFARAQVFGLLVIELLAAGFFIWMRPFEGQRLNLLVVYALAISKVMSVGLSAAFIVDFELPRITATAIGIIIIVIQGILTVITMIATVIGAISSYMSLSRSQDGDTFRPKKWAGIREKYFDHLDCVVDDLPSEPRKAKRERKKQAKVAKQLAKNASPFDPLAEPEKVGFQVHSFRRNPKIEDEDELFASEIVPFPTLDAELDVITINNASTTTLTRPPLPSSNISRPVSRASVSSGNLPYGARPHRPSWSAMDFHHRIHHRRVGSSEEELIAGNGVEEEDLKILPKVLPKEVLERDRVLRERESGGSLKRRLGGGRVGSRGGSSIGSGNDDDTAFPDAACLDNGGESPPLSSSSVANLPFTSVPPPPMGMMRPRAGTGGSGRKVSSGSIICAAGASASHSAAGGRSRNNSISKVGGGREWSGGGSVGGGNGGYGVGGYGVVVEEVDEEEEGEGKGDGRKAGRKGVR